MSDNDGQAVVEADGEQRLGPGYWLAVAAAATLLVSLVVVFFSVRVCDDQVARDGSVVSVCRHMEVTDPPAAALGLAVLALLIGTVFGEVSAFGITLKARVKNVENLVAKVDEVVKHVAAVQLDLQREQQKLDALTNEVAEVSRKAQEKAEAALENSEDVFDNPALRGSPPAEAVAEASGDHPVDDLVAKYNLTRSSMPRGWERSRQMDSIVRDLKAVLTSAEGFDPAPYLASKNRGERLAAYAYLEGSPRRDLDEALVSATFSEDKPFGEWHGLLALAALFHRYPVLLTSERRDRLTKRLGELPEGTDRAVAIRGILAGDRP